MTNIILMPIGDVLVPMNADAAGEGLVFFIDLFERLFGRFWWIAWTGIGGGSAYLGEALARWNLSFGSDASIWWPQSGGDWFLSVLVLVQGCAFGPFMPVTLLLLVLGFAGMSWLLG
jgi:hypothetical protein